MKWKCRFRASLTKESQNNQLAGGKNPLPSPSTCLKQSSQKPRGPPERRIPALQMKHVTTLFMHSLIRARATRNEQMLERSRGKVVSAAWLSPKHVITSRVKDPCQHRHKRPLSGVQLGGSSVTAISSISAQSGVSSQMQYCQSQWVGSRLNWQFLPTPSSHCSPPSMSFLRTSYPTEAATHKDLWVAVEDKRQDSCIQLMENRFWIRPKDWRQHVITALVTPLDGLSALER